MIKDDELHQRRQTKVLTYVDDHDDGVSREDAARVMRCSNEQAYYEIRLMVICKMLVRVGSGVHARYCRPGREGPVIEAMEERRDAKFLTVTQRKVSAAEAKVDKQALPACSVFAWAGAMA